MLVRHYVFIARCKNRRRGTQVVSFTSSLLSLSSSLFFAKLHFLRFRVAVRVASGGALMTLQLPPLPLLPPYCVLYCMASASSASALAAALFFPSASAFSFAYASSIILSSSPSS